MCVCVCVCVCYYIDCVFDDKLPRCTQDSCRDITPCSEEGGREKEGGGEEEGKVVKGLVKPGEWGE